MRRIVHVLLVAVAIVLAYLCSRPSASSRWHGRRPRRRRSIAAPMRATICSKGIERIARGIGKGPEAIAFDAQGRIYTGFEDGRVARFEPDGSGYTLIANTGGRPLGVFVHPDGSVIVCDAKKGLSEGSARAGRSRCWPPRPWACHSALPTTSP